MKKINIARDLREALEERRQAFLEKFGREPGDGDPIFFDPDADQPRFQTEAQQKEIQEKMCAVMIKVGIDPAFIFAFRKTGRILTTENKRFLTRSELAEWNDAIEEYQSCNGTKQ